MSDESTLAVQKSTARSMLEAILNGDGEAWGAFSSSLDGKYAYRVLTAATTAAAWRKWPNDPSLREVADYAAGIAGRFPGEFPIAPGVIEAVIRAAFGEPELIKGTPGKDVVVADLALLRTLRYEVLNDPIEREAYIDEVLDSVS